jgi:hypothetical protein
MDPEVFCPKFILLALEPTLLYQQQNDGRLTYNSEI